MPFDWTRYIRLAEILKRDADSLADRESCLRSAISRAYYGAFGLAREMAVRGGLTLTRSPRDHRNVIEHFRALEMGSQDPSQQAIYKKIALELDRLRAARNQADYDDRIPDLERRTSLALKRARRIERKIAQISSR